MKLIVLILVWTMVVMVHFGPAVRMQSLGQPDLGNTTDAERLVDQVNSADRIVMGTVSSVESRYASNEAGDHLIVSTVAVSVSENMKGRRGGNLTFELVGGSVGGITMGSSDQEIVPTAGDNIIAMVARSVAISHGVIKLTAAGALSEGHATPAQVRAAIRGETE